MAIGAFVLLTIAGTCLDRHSRPAPEHDVTLFTASVPGCSIVLPADPIAQERRAAETLQQTFVRASGRAATDFPILSEARTRIDRAVYVGATRRGADFLRPTRKPPYATGVGELVRGGVVFIRSENRDSIESAVAWFLEQHAGAYWFIPGPLGEVVPERDELRIACGERTARPGFLHRDLGVQGRQGEAAWYARNKLETQFDHGHNLGNIFRPADFRRAPEMAPRRDGQRYIPSETSFNWQPDMLSLAAAKHAADVANRAFAADRRRLSFSLSENDSDRFDESPATLAAIAPLRYFRFRPDYSNLVFRFTNAVAERVARRHPGRFLPAYAYYWCENVPSFPVARNVVPFLTADRTRWSFPEFQAEDRALIEKWCHSGAEIVGVYDYLEGAPYLCPRPALNAVADAIPFEFKAGVRAFFGEGPSNWALDGPKAWLAAQLLWSPERNPRELLDIYYREFWAEAATPMREFFERCESVWRRQPGPPLWLRYYADEDQSHIYSKDEREALRGDLTRAAKLARSETVRARVAFVSDAFAITEAFADFTAAREDAHRKTQTASDPATLAASWHRYRQLNADFTRRYEELRRREPLTFGSQDIDLYRRNQPDGRIARELVRTEAGKANFPEYLAEVYLGATSPQISALFTRGVECLVDPSWSQVLTRPINTHISNDWTLPGSTWTGAGEAWQGRTLELRANAVGGRVLRMAGCRTESLGQWVPAIPNSLYAAQVRIEARTSPGTATSLIVNFLDANQRHLGLGRSDRLPASPSTVQETSLCVVVRAPANARYVGFAVQAWNQIDDDFAEFSEASLKRLVE